MLLDARTAIPSPVIYVGAAVAGTVLGIPLDLVLGWPWWAVALGSGRRSHRVRAARCGVSVPVTRFRRLCSQRMNDDSCDGGQKDQ